MTNEERDLITQFVARVGGTQAPAAAPGAMAPLPPVDHDADALIADLFTRYPEARYRVTQLAYVSEHALVEAQNRINRLQWELQNLQRQRQAPPAQGGSPWGAAAGAAAEAAAAQPQQRGFFSSLFGGGQQAPQGQPPYAQPQYAAPPPPQYPPNYNPGAFQQQGSGFLGGALRTAAGVAGGVVAADALMSLFSGNHGGGFGGGGFGGGGFGGGFGGQPEVIEYNTTNINEGGGGPWGGAPTADPDVGGYPPPPPPDQSAWATPPDQGADWRDADPGPSDQGGGWDQASDDSSSDSSSFDNS